MISSISSIPQARLSERFKSSWALCMLSITLQGLDHMNCIRRFMCCVSVFVVFSIILKLSSALTGNVSNNR